MFQLQRRYEPTRRLWLLALPPPDSRWRWLATELSNCTTYLWVFVTWKPTQLTPKQLEHAELNHVMVVTVDNC